MMANYHHFLISKKSQSAEESPVKSYIEPEQQYIVQEVLLLAIYLQSLLHHRLCLAMVFGENQACFLKPAEYKINNETEMIEYRILPPSHSFCPQSKIHLLFNRNK